VDLLLALPSDGAESCPTPLMKVPPSLLLPFAALALVSAEAAPSATPAKPTSEFTTTDLKKVKLLERASESSATYLCPGFGQYRIVYQIAEGRSWVDVLFGETLVALSSDTFSACQGGNPWKANAVVQWRGYRKGNQFVPYGLIYRMYSESSTGQKPHDALVIVKLNGAQTRVVGKVPGNAGNQAAENLADRLCAAGGDEPGPYSAAAPRSRVEAAPSVAGVSGAPAQGALPPPDPKRVVAVRTEDGTVLIFPNGQRFSLPPGKGLLGPPEEPSSQVPFEIEGGWFVGVNECPAVHCSTVHLYLKGKNGRWGELPNVQSRLLKIINSRSVNPEFLRIAAAQVGNSNDALLYIEQLKQGEREPTSTPIAVSRAGNLTYGGRGE
jgi:hypothetical protein